MTVYCCACEYKKQILTNRKKYNLKYNKIAEQNHVQQDSVKEH